MNLILVYRLFFVIIFVNTFSTIFAFYAFTWEDLLYQMRKNMSWEKARIETNTQVFDPFTKNLDIGEKSYPIELPARGFNQIIHWQDGKVMVIETKDKKGNLLHFYYENNGDVLSVSLDKKRIFSEKEIFPIQLKFKSRYEKDRIKALYQFGIVNKNIAYHIKNDNKVSLRIGSLESGHFALINPKTYELESVHSKIWTGKERWLDLKIVYKKYEKYRWQLYPVITEYFLNEKLFKRVTVTKIRTLSKLPMKNLKKQALNLKFSQPAQLKNDYAL